MAGQHPCLTMVFLLIFCPSLYQFEENAGFSEGVSMERVTHLGLGNLVSNARIDILSGILRKQLEFLKRGDNLMVELVFVIDGSSSVGEENFQNVLKFVRKLVVDLPVGANATRIALITFASEIKASINHVEEDVIHYDKCTLFQFELQKISYTGGNTFTLGAIQEAARILEKSRPGAKRAIFLITDGFSNNGDPVPVALELKQAGTKIFTFGIRSGNVEELQKISSVPHEEFSFLLESFTEFDALARRALHQDLGEGTYIKVPDSQHCSVLCDKADGLCCNENATCSCGSSSGHFGCLCGPGHYGTGLFDQPCLPCPKGTYGEGNVPGDVSTCQSCPDRNQNTKKYPATSLNDCICKEGFVPGNLKCEVVTCPLPIPPKNGYFVKEKCSNVLNAACGVRCNIGFELMGSSVRICQKNGTWTGNQPICKAKHCPSLKAVAHAEVVCSHEDEGYQKMTSYGERGQVLKEIVKRKPVHKNVILENETTNEFTVDTECRFGCPVGFTMIGSKLRTCLPLTRWDGLQTTCKPIVCSSLQKIPYGIYEPNNCTSPGVKHRFGAVCTVTCKSGFKLKGNSSRVCSGKYGSWTGKTLPYKCLDVEAPIFHCPSNVTIGTDGGAPYATIIDFTLPVSSDNSGIAPIIWTEPSLTRDGFIFPILPIGRNEIEIHGADATGNSAKCTFRIDVKDLERPTVENCESPEVMTLDELKEMKWSEPIFSDNSGNYTITKSIVMDSTHATSVISYTAIDPSGNQQRCDVNITIGKDKECSLPNWENHSDANCTTNQTEKQCIIFCESGFYSPLQKLSVICRNGKWISIDSHDFTQAALNCSEITEPQKITQSMDIIVQNEEDFCNDQLQLSHLENEIRSIINDGEISIALECKQQENEQESNVISSSVSHKRKRETQTRQKVTVQFSRGYLKKDEQLFGATSNKSLRIFLENENIQLNGRFVTAQKNIQEVALKCDVGSVLSGPFCVKCGVGEYWESAPRRCCPCPAGSYQPHRGQISCVPCPPSHTTLDIGKSSKHECKRICPPNFYGVLATKDQIGVAPCIHCPFGDYQLEQGKTQCISCPPWPKRISGCPLTFGCKSNSCKNNGICSSTLKKCICKNLFYGVFCEKSFEPCDSSPCLNGGHCQKVSATEFACKCLDGYDGKTCENEKDLCLGQLCQNGATCESGYLSFHCVCSPGYRGDTCGEVIDECALQKPCQNNGTCFLSQHGFRCSCTDHFKGKYCEMSSVCLPDEEWFCKANELRTDDHYDYGEKTGPEPLVLLQQANLSESAENKIVLFPKCSTTDYMVTRIKAGSMAEFSVCVWVQTADSFNFGTLCSYATSTEDNEFTITDYNGFVVYVSGQRVVTDVIVNDGQWHFICVTWTSESGNWRIYVDGSISASGTNLAKKSFIRGGGLLIAGQEQDRQGGGFNEVESFVGKMTQLEVWEKELLESEVQTLFTSCLPVYIEKSLSIWPRLLLNMRGNTTVSPSDFCKMCKKPPPIYRSNVTVNGYVAKYECEDGFMLKFTEEHMPSNSTIWERKCQKTGEWESSPPKCTRVGCGPPGSLFHGTVIGSSHLYQDVVQYKCHPPYTLVGTSSRTCLANGSWSGNKPQCSMEDSNHYKSKCSAVTSPRRSSLFIDLNDRIEIMCDPGYHLYGFSTLTCMPHGGWDYQLPFCSMCPPPVLPSGVTWEAQSEKEELILKCQSSSNEYKSQCENGKWNIPATICGV